MKQNTALVLEGGALRGLYTSGVLDVFLKNKINFDYVVGVSAGSLNGVNYLAKQIYRSRFLNLNFINDHRYLGLHNYFTANSIINLDFLINEATQYYPFDNYTYEHNPTNFDIVLTDIDTCQPFYYSANKNDKKLTEALKGSCAMPVVSHISKIDHHKYLDGGVASAIPYKRAIDLGYQKIVVVLTRDATYHKHPLISKEIRLIKVLYHHYPKLIKTMINNPEKYNKMLLDIHQLEQEHKLFIIQPSVPINISHTEKDTKILADVYNLGVQNAEENLDTLLKYLNN